MGVRVSAEHNRVTSQPVTRQFKNHQKRTTALWFPYHEQRLVRVTSQRSTWNPYKLVYSFVCLHWFIMFLSVKSMGLKRKHKGEILLPAELFPRHALPGCWRSCEGSGLELLADSWEPAAAGWVKSPAHQWSTLPLGASLRLTYQHPQLATKSN